MAKRIDDPTLPYALQKRTDHCRPPTREQRRRIWLSPLVALIVICALVAGLGLIAWLTVTLVGVVPVSPIR